MDGARIDRNGIRGLAVSFFLLFLCVAVLFIAAGTLNWPGAWVYFGLVLAYQVVYSVVLIRLNPEMLNERGRFAKKGTKGFDLVYFVLYLPVTVGGLVVIGLDRRYGWSSVPWWAGLAGAAVLVISFCVGLWALAVNPYFECTVRIQQDRNQTVVASGPYRFVRHPGYLGLVMSLLTVPLILGSWWGFIPYGVTIIGVVTRTALEDRTLKKELPGYREYAARTRFRLLPPVW